MTAPNSKFATLAEESNKKNEAYHRAFNEYFSNLPSSSPTSNLANLSLGPTQAKDEHILRDALGCRLEHKDQEHPTDYDSQEEQHLERLADRFGDKLPYLKNWLADFQKNRRVSDKMPANREDEATGNITDQVAKESSSSEASSHGLHDVDTGAKDGGGDAEGLKASIEHHKANPGPVQTGDNLPEKKGKDELKARAAELNK